MKISLEADLRIIEDFDSFQKAIRKEVIENGVDAALNQSLEELKNTLKDIVNKGTVPEKKGIITKEETEEHTIKIPKSDEEILKFLTGVDVDKVNKNKDFTSAVESNVAFVMNKKNKQLVRYRMNMDANETFDDHYNKAKNFYNQALFVFADGAGNTKYYANPGIDLSQYVKVVCSRETGDTKKSRDKFELHRDRRGYADWALKAEVLRTIQSSFIDVSSIIDEIKDGDFEEAKRISSTTHKNLKRVSEFEEKIDSLRTRDKLTPGITGYTNTVTLIRNLKILKKVQEDKVTYELISDYSGEGNEVGFFDEIERNVALWVMTNEDKWFQAIVMAAAKVIKNFEGR